jgi:RNA binding exosome subunit
MRVILFHSHLRKRQIRTFLPQLRKNQTKEEAVLFHNHHQSNEKGNYFIKIGYLMT